MTAYESYVKQLNWMAGKRIGGVAEEEVKTATQQLQEALQNMVREIRVLP